PLLSILQLRSCPVAGVATFGGGSIRSRIPTRCGKTERIGVGGASRSHQKGRRRVEDRWVDRCGGCVGRTVQRENLPIVGESGPRQRIGFVLLDRGRAGSKFGGGASGMDGVTGNAHGLVETVSARQNSWSR